MSEAIINSSILEWAMRRGRFDPGDVARKVGVGADRIESWIGDADRPTFRQAQDLARILCIPFGFLFLPEPPTEVPTIPDLRTTQNQGANWLSPDFQDLLADVLRKQNWYRDFRSEQGASPLPFIGRFRPETPVQLIARDVTDVLGLTESDRKAAANWEEFLDLLMQKAEGAGISVMRSGIVGVNTHRTLEVEEFRGFALCDEIAPVVFVNGADAKAAQIFTLVHELSHLWIGQTGVSNMSLAQSPSETHNDIERLCDRVAAEVLLPSDSVRVKWKRQDSLVANANSLARYFRVSSVVAARKGCDLGIVEWDEYMAFYRQQQRIWKEEKRSQSPGGNLYLSTPVRNGRELTKAVVIRALEHNLLLRDAGKLLDINPGKVTRLAQEMKLL